MSVLGGDPVRRPASTGSLRSRIADLEATRDQLARDLEDVREAHEASRELIDLCPDGIVVIDLDGRVLYANRQAGALTPSRDASSLLGRQVLDIVHPEQRGAAGERLRKIRQTGEPLDRTERRILRVDGEVLDLEIAVARIRFDGAPAAIVVARDVTERKRRERAFVERAARERQQLAELDHLYRTAPVGLAFHDPELRYIRVNERLAAAHGRSVEEHVGLHLRDVVPEIAPIVEPIFKRVMETGEPILEVEVEGSTATAKGRTFLASFYPVKGPDGSILGVSNVVQDITERKEAERACARDAARLERDVARREEANRELRALQGQLMQAERLQTAEGVAATVAHAINNPLMALIGMVELRLESAGEADPELERVARIGRRIKSVVERMLQHSRRGDLTLTEVAAADVLEDVREELGPRCVLKGIRLHVSAHADAGRVRADRELLVAALVSVAENSVEVLSEGGTIWLEVRPMTAISGATFRIADDGPGIPEEIRERVFEPYFSTTTTGAGLGLAIARGIVQGHSGRIRLGLREGGGTEALVEISGATLRA